MFCNLPKPKVIITYDSPLFKELIEFLDEKHPNSEEREKAYMEIDRLIKWDNAYKVSMEMADFLMKGHGNMKSTTKLRLKILRDWLDKRGEYFSIKSDENEQWFDTFDFMFAIDNAVEVLELMEGIKC